MKINLSKKLKIKKFNKQVSIPLPHACKACALPFELLSFMFSAKKKMCLKKHLNYLNFKIRLIKLYNFILLFIFNK